ncbi:MAG: cobaltochelatase subunit CobS, partial [Hyphomonadaceae bacterium]
MAVTDPSDALISLVPTKELDAKKTFGIDLDWKVPAFAERSSYVPDHDPAYR